MTPSFPSSTHELRKVNADQIKLLAIFRFIGAGLATVAVLLLSSGICFAQTLGGTVVAWGDDSFGQTNVPAGLTNSEAIAAAAYRSVALKHNRTVVVWGNLTYGQSAPPSLSNVVAIAAGTDFNLALQTNGNVVAWGRNTYGDATVPNGLGNVVTIAAGYMHGLAVMTNGAVVAWGWNRYGQTNVPVGLTNAVAVAGGEGHSLAFRSDGTVIGWGDNSDGQISVPADLSNVVAIAAGFDHSLALRNDGSVVAWGRNSYGQSSVPSSATNIVAIAASEMFSLALRADGTLVAWGSQSGVPAWGSNIVAIAAGESHCLALRNDNLSFVGREPFTRIAYTGGTVLLKSGIIGIPPSTYQWQCNGTNLSGANAALLVFTNLQLADSGTYRVIVTNVFGVTISSNVDLQVLNSAPIIQSQPVRKTAIPGTNAIFEVKAVGSLPLSYQWQFNGTNINGATNTTLLLTNLLLADEGDYQAVVTNVFGATNSSSAYLDVVDLGEALNATNLIWASTGDVPWFVENTVVHDAFAAAQSGVITNGQQSVLQTTVLGPGTLTFWWNINSMFGYGYNFLIYSINGLEQSRISFISGWLPVTNYLGTGEQVLQWTFTQPVDSAVSPAGYVDQVSYTPGGTAPFVTLSPTNQVILLGSNVTLNAAALGTPPLSYQWQLNGASLDGATNTSLSLTNAQFANEGNYSLVISNAFGVTNTTPVFVNVVDFNESLNATNLTWNTGGDAPWFPENSITHDGVAALQSGAIGANQQSTLQTTVNGPGTLSFWWKVSSETNNDYASFSLDGVEQSRISGMVNWQEQTCYLTPGTHTLLWDYSNNATVNGGSDAAWLDQVSYTNGATPAYIISGPTNLVLFNPSNAIFTVVAQGTPPLAYQWQLNGTNIAGATSPVLTLDSWDSEGSYSVVVSNAYGGMVSSNATLTLLRSQIVAWGQGFDGQTNVPASIGNVLAISAGWRNSMALKSDGTVAVWGANYWGQTNVPSGLSNVVAIACGNFQDCLALKSDGTAVGWGMNDYNKATIPAGVSNIVAITAGDNHSMVLQNSGKVIAWGSNSSGQTNVPADLTNAIAIAAGSGHSLALRSDGTVVAWGDDSAGQTNVPATLTNVVAIAACGNDSLALQKNGVVVAWGSDSYGLTNVPTGLTNVIAIAAGASDNMALRDDGTVVVWGDNNFNQTNPPAGLNKVIAIAAGDSHCLALLNDGPPIVAVQPHDLANYAGFTVALNASALGLHPLTYQWQFDGTNIADATNCLLTLADIQPANAGTYALIVSNSLGMTISSNATLTVITNPPSIALQPTNQSATIGSNVTFSVVVGTGPIPDFYQWKFDDTNITDATNSVFTLTNIQATDQGNYSVTVNNGYGTVTSSNAYLTVLPDLPTALNTPGWTWTTSGSAGWFAQTNTSHDGIAAAQSGTVGGHQSSTLQTTVTGPGTLTFWWMFSGSSFLDTLSFVSSQGNNSAILNSTAGWQRMTFYLGAGQQTLTWNYFHYFFGTPQSTGWVDQVSFTPGVTPPAIALITPSVYVRADSSTTLFVGAYGTPPLAYQWKLNGTNLLNETNSFLNFTSAQPTDSGMYSVMITNDFGIVSTNTTLWVGQFTLSTNPTNLFMSTNGFQLKLDGILTSKPVIVWSSTDLVNWLPLFTNPPTTGSLQFLDRTATNLPARFYRAQE